MVTANNSIWITFIAKLRQLESCFLCSCTVYTSKQKEDLSKLNINSVKKPMNRADYPPWSSIAPNWVSSAYICQNSWFTARIQMKITLQLDEKHFAWKYAAYIYLMVPTSYNMSWQFLKKLFPNVKNIRQKMNEESPPTFYLGGWLVQLFSNVMMLSFIPKSRLKGEWEQLFFENLFSQCNHHWKGLSLASSRDEKKWAIISCPLSYLVEVLRRRIFHYKSQSQ